MKFEIKNRFSGEVIFSLECGSLKLCVEAAVKSSADLRSADLYGADLRSANLYNANLYSADLGSANLYGANLYNADLGEKAGKLLDKGFFQCGPVGSRNDRLFAFHTDKGIFVSTGCFFGSLDEFREKVNQKPGGDKWIKEYLGLANWIEWHFTGENK